MTKKELRDLALATQSHAGAKLIQGCLIDIWLNDKVSNDHGNWAVSVRVDDLMELCAAALKETK
jgi:hypothetical protein